MAKITKSLSSKIRKEDGKAEVMLRFIGGRGAVLRAKSNIFIVPDRWSDTSGDIKTSRLHPDTLTAQKQLSELCTAIVEAFGAIHKEQATKEWLAEVVERYHYPNKYLAKEAEKQEQTLFEWVEYFISIAPQRKDKETGKLLSKNNIQQYNATYKHLKGFAKLCKKVDFSFKEINVDFYNGFVSFLQELNFTANSVGKHVRILKLMLNESPKALQLQADYSKFKVFTEDVDNIYLNKEELQQLKDCDFAKAPHLDRVRDWFLLLAWTGSRFSDLAKIGKRNIKDGFISFRQQKTNAQVTIPLHPIVIEILQKYDFNMPEPISNQRFNEYIKEVARIAGFDSEESLTRTVASELVTTQFPKYELISSHTGRRSFATNMYKEGLPTLMIMSITGHKTEKSFLKYIKVTQKEHAEMMANKWAEMYNK